MSDNELWYDHAASVWTEALPVGNGRLGAMVFGDAWNERLQINESTFWSGGPYQPINPDARAALPEVRNLILAGRYQEADRKAYEGPWPSRIGRPPISRLAMSGSTCTMI